MKRLNLFLSAVLVLLFAGFYNIAPVVAADGLPPVQNGSPIDSPPPTYSVFLPAISNSGPATLSPQSDPLEDLIDVVVNGQADQLVGVYVADLLSMPVVQQPEGDSTFISSTDNTVTEFSAATKFGNTGLLAHNTKAGSQFFNLEVNQQAVLIFGDGTTRSYQIESIRSYQALEPNNPYSDFIDLSHNSLLSANDLFLETYGAGDQLIFQTCIEAEGVNSWGRIFVTATPL